MKLKGCQHRTSHPSSFIFHPSSDVDDAPDSAEMPELGHDDHDKEMARVLQLSTFDDDEDSAGGQHGEVIPRWLAPEWTMESVDAHDAYTELDIDGQCAITCPPLEGGMLVPQGWGH